MAKSMVTSTQRFRISDGWHHASVSASKVFLRNSRKQQEGPKNATALRAVVIQGR